MGNGLAAGAAGGTSERVGDVGVGGKKDGRKARLWTGSFSLWQRGT